jgi:hypothetical protein
VQEATETHQIRQAQGRFAAMSGAYFLGAFNDNFFKQAVMLMAVAAGQVRFQGVAGMAFTLPFLLLAAPAGWLADRFPKRNIVIAAKGLELVASLVGALGVALGQLWIMIGMVGLMGIQSAFFSPALNGSIPEIYPADHVTRANALLRMIVTTGILLGITLSGLCLGVQGGSLLGIGRGRALIGLVTTLFSVAGLLVSLRIPTRKAADPSRPFPLAGPADTCRELGRIWRDRMLGRILVADVFIWSVGVFQLLVINTLGLKQFHLTESRTSLLVACQLIGLAVGGLLAGRIAKGERWFKVLVPAVLAMGLLMLAIAGVPLLPSSIQVVALFLFIGLAGIAGGLFLIPCESFLQVRPSPERKGAVWASTNFASFLGMSVVSLAYSSIPALSALLPTLAYGALGLLSLFFGGWMAAELRRAEWPAA